jgi:LacI family transcriptional regulator
MTVTIKDIAREAGVSDATVSLSFSGHPRISDKTREKVLKVASRLKYSPNLPARILRSGGIRAIGFLVNDITNPFYASMIQQAESVANEQGYQLIIAESQWNPSKEVKAIETLISTRVKGLLVILTEQTPQSVQLLAQTSIPVIAVDTRPPSFKGSFIGNDLIATGRIAAQHLLEVGCQHPIFLTALPPMQGFSAFVDLQKGFVQALKNHSMEFADPPVIPAGLTIEEGASAFSRIWRAHPQTDGLLCANDLCALGVIMMADREGIRIGKDLRVMGIDNLEVSALPRISLTSIRQPYDQIAQTSTRMLIEHIERQAPLKKCRALLPELIVRQSTQPDQKTRVAGATGSR